MNTSKTPHDEAEIKRLEILGNIDLMCEWLMLTNDRPLLESFVSLAKTNNVLPFDKAGKENPSHPYQLAVIRLGRELKKLFARRNLEFGEDFPGDYKCSYERHEHGIEVRIFSLPLYRNGEIHATLHTSFYHTHAGFNLPKPPSIHLEKCW